MSAQVDVLAMMDEFVVVVGDEFGNEFGLRLRDARAAVAALIAERDALRFALRDIANNCRRGANEQGMSPQGVSAIAEICDAALTTGESA